MKTIVVDASCIAGYLLEHNSDIVGKIRDLLYEKRKQKIQLISTSLLPLEVANALRFNLRDPSLANEAFEKFQQLPIDIILLTAIQIEKSIELSYACKTTVYDASYHVLAIARDSQYLTADAEYFKKAKHLGHIQYL